MQENGQKAQQDKNARARAAAESVLPVLVRSLLQAGLAPQSLREVVERALEDWQGVPTSPSRASRQDLEDLARVLSIWHTSPRYVDKKGAPRALRQQGRQPSFEALAKLAIPSLRPEEALKCLLMAGAVEVGRDDRVRALMREFVTQRWDEAGVWRWHQVVRRLLETLEFNYAAPGRGWLERFARTERLPARYLPIFNEWVYHHGGEFLEMADDWLAQHERPGEPTENDVATGIGLYMFVDDFDDRG